MDYSPHPEMDVIDEVDCLFRRSASRFKFRRTQPMVQAPVTHKAVLNIQPMSLLLSDADVALCGGAVDLDLRNKNGDTPLHIALKEMEEDQDRFEIVQELICCGAECKRRPHTTGICAKSISFRKRIIANPPCDDEDDEVEIQPEQLRKQMYDRSDFVDDVEDGSEGSSLEAE
ncbi:uncharacterized protein F5147DRAFT_778596 [Suillus discolor]|uniref:Uncharacterized protein n=1 Tax=Suillus discolor TaxID=1912936 RepID=A0A9P7JP37_9AGAM|nr:uncharacterized protein F5147DRAFT_778596 [Suillus discolor]KAG2095691.1 hypothetical protein F5147DRAFT_778596 [Suillus discolor]